MASTAVPQRRGGRWMEMKSYGNDALSISRDAAWYLVHRKPRQGVRAEESLLRQGYDCYRPQHRRERLVQGRRQAVVESLSPGYQFIQLANNANWAPLRSTRGVSYVIGFGGQPLSVGRTTATAHANRRRVGMGRRGSRPHHQWQLYRSECHLHVDRRRRAGGTASEHAQSSAAGQPAPGKHCKKLNNPGIG